MTRTGLFMKRSKPWQPRKYQMTALKFMTSRNAAGLFLEPGLGKTSTTLACIKWLKSKGMIEKVLLIAPLRVCYSVWPNEIEKWDDFKGLTYTILHGKDKDKNLEKEVDIYLINPEGLDWLLKPTKVSERRVSVDMKRWKKFGFDMLVIDELSKFKHYNTARFKAMRNVLGTFRYRYGLTGSPAANGLMDLFGQCYMLDMGNSLGQYITQFRSKYFEKGWDGFTYTIRDGAEEEIYKKLAPLVLSMKADDHLDMPQVVENNIEVDLPDDVMELYKKFEDTFFAAVDNKVITAVNAATASGKCRQIACGGIYISDSEGLIKKFSKERKWVDLHTAKIDALEDLIDELQGSPLLVAYDFEHDLERIKKRLGKDVPYIGGGVSVKRSTELAELWNAGKLPVLFGHPQSMGHGLNLQEAGCHVCWHSLTWNFELYDQFVRRVLRQGNTSKRVFVHHILAKGTIDYAVLEAVRSKCKGQNALFQALKNYRGK